jgi:hypothetical protein
MSTPSDLVTIVIDELRRQRTFLSTDEAAALRRRSTDDDESDLALDRVRRRRLVIFTALRDRFIRDGRPVGAWSELIVEAEATSGGETVVSQLARQVLVWNVRTADRGVMLGGFAAQALRWLGLLLLFLAGWSWLQGAATVIVVAVGLVATGLVVVAIFRARRVANRSAVLAAAVDRTIAAAGQPGGATPDGALEAN